MQIGTIFRYTTYLNYDYFIINFALLLNFQFIYTKEAYGYVIVRIQNLQN